MRARERDRIRCMEQDGTMERRRTLLRAYFATHPDAAPQQAVRALRLSYPDHMYVVADSVKLDVRREAASETARQPPGETPTDGGQMPEIPADAWFKSSESGANGCVEVAHVPEGGVAIRDSKDTTKAAHFYTRDEWSAFLIGAKNGEFDLPALV